MRVLLICIAIVAIGALGWLAFRDGGWLNQMTEERVEDALIANGVPVGMAECMAPKLTEELSINQLRKLERLKPQQGESRIPSSVSIALNRLERVDDAEAVRVLGITATRCGVGSLLDRLK